MRSDDVDVLQLLVNAATTWRANAKTQGVELDILTTRINGDIVQLEWDANTLVWNIRTADSRFQMTWTENTTDPSLSKWIIVSV
jgi:hypothetical protein